MPQSPIATFSQYSGGQLVARGVTGATQTVKPAPGVIRKISVTTVLPGAGVQVWDGAVAGDATAPNLLYNNPTALAAGTVIDLNMPVSKGILITCGTGVVAVSYN
jgi:hypothetical protein